MRLTLTQQTILQDIRKHGSTTPTQVMQITGCVYRDRPDCVWQTLGRMVKAGLIKRIGPGEFGLKGNE